MNVRRTRLMADHELLREGLRDHPAISIRGVSGTPPDRYQIEYRVRSLAENARGDVVEKHEHVAEIFLTLAYPRLAPQCRMLSPVFHPNIAPHAVCIGDHWAAGESLLNLVVRIGEMLAFQSYNTRSPLNGAAARWVDANIGQLPTDPRDLSPRSPAQEEAEPSAAGLCQNCRAAGRQLTACSSGHEVCPDCTVKCLRCGKDFCVLCKLHTCDVCGSTICPDCASACPSCNRVVCREHMAACSACGQTGCPDCIIECSTCGAPACLEHIRQCATCRAVLCPEHAAECSGCGAWLCARHGRTCALCSRCICPECGEECSECGRPVCLEHVSQCAECKRVLCSEHTGLCSRCGKPYCSDHGDVTAAICSRCAPSATTVTGEPGRVVCSTCGAKFTVPPELSGRRGLCPKCRSTIAL